MNGERTVNGLKKPTDDMRFASKNSNRNPIRNIDVSIFVDARFRETMNFLTQPSYRKCYQRVYSSIYESSNRRVFSDCVRFFLLLCSQHLSSMGSRDLIDETTVGRHQSNTTNQGVLVNTAERESMNL